ncbi:unnamed protein product [Ambrosiozyma monospora]|uniref:Unnamed protein product n=1 Tax=Ambrosiozyma monospora TaxID=43982 RepID=A0ACB5SRT6_AMBMO|nr:unnamed protein product [Ambrosiozyma monospora]
MQRSLFNISRNALRTSAAAQRRAAVYAATKPQFTQPVFRQFSATTRFLNEKKTEQTNEPKETAEAKKEEKKDEQEAPAEEDEITKLQKKLEAKDKEVAEFKDRYIRSVADFRNLQETTKREIQKAKDFALQKFAKDLIESIDNFGHALGAVKDETVKTNKEVAQLYEGVKMTRDIFEKTLAKHGLTKIDPLDEEFDPNKHEATFQSPQPGKEPGTVFFVQQPGFALNGRVLRPAKVGVVKGEE